MNRRPYVSIPQAGPGHKAVTLVIGRDRVRIECASNEQARALSMSLIGTFKSFFPKTGEATKRSKKIEGDVSHLQHIENTL